MYFLKQLKRAGLSSTHLLEYYIAVIRPVLEYCVPVWHHVLTKEQSKQIEAIQKRAIYIIFTLCYAIFTRRYASAGNSDRNVSVRPSVRLSVRLSVTRRYCVKMKKASGMISSPSGSPKTLVFRRQISSPNSKRFPPNGGLKQGSVGKIQRFSSFRPKRQYLENGSRYGQSYY